MKIRFWGGLLCLSGALLASCKSSENSASSGEAMISESARKGKPGPWGQLYSYHIYLEPPDEFMPESGQFQGQITWFLGDMPEAAVRSQMKDFGFTSEQIESLFHSRVKPESVGFEAKDLVFTPPVSWVLGMTPELRAHWYGLLAQHTENAAQSQPHVFRKDEVDHHFQGSGLAEDSIRRFKELLYPVGDLLMFSDARAVFESIRAESEKRLFLKVLGRVKTQIVRLHLKQGQNVDEIAHYWSHSSNAKDIRVILKSVAQRKGGGFLDITHLLPPWVRRYLYTYAPASEEPQALWKNCHWTSFNFFNEEPQDRYLSPEDVNRALREDYVPIPAPSEFGDLVVLSHRGDVVHSAVFIADDIVFTKNGASFLKPWTLMNLEDVHLFYSIPGTPLETHYFRRKR